jgi:hypothetical protein
MGFFYWRRRRRRRRREVSQSIPAWKKHHRCHKKAKLLRRTNTNELPVLPPDTTVIAVLSFLTKAWTMPQTGSSNSQPASQRRANHIIPQPIVFPERLENTSSSSLSPSPSVCFTTTLGIRHQSRAGGRYKPRIGSSSLLFFSPAVAST